MVQQGLIQPVLALCYAIPAANTNCRRMNSTQADFIILGAAPLPPDVRPDSVQVCVCWVARPDARSCC
jgi:hypothetical protein